MLAEPPFNILENLQSVDDALDANADIADQILAHSLPAFGLSRDPQSSEREWRRGASEEDMNKARMTINQFYRDWSAQGASERNACYEPVLKDVEELFLHVPTKDDLKILVPGAGLGRLVFEICRQGYTVEGNEISYHQLLASAWVLNHSARAEQLELFPFVQAFNNVVSREHQLQAVKIPDVHPATELEKASASIGTHAFDRMSMTASDFIVLYGNEEHSGMFDAVITVFFLDTAPNVIRYIEVVRNCLKNGGAWINNGPLLWHFGDRVPKESSEGQEKQQPQEREGIGEPGSVELTVEEVLLLVEKMGFLIEKQEILESSLGYIHNHNSLSRYTYSLSHWVARKKGSKEKDSRDCDD